MSFSANVKSELCRPEVEKGCCALAEAMGALLYANTFSADAIRIVTESRDLGLRLPRLFRKGLGVSFDLLPEEGGSGKLTYTITDREKIRQVFSACGFSAETSVSLHVNFAHAENFVTFKGDVVEFKVTSFSDYMPFGYLNEEGRSDDKLASVFRKSLQEFLPKIGYKPVFEIFETINCFDLFKHFISLLFKIKCFNTTSILSFCKTPSFGTTINIRSIKALLKLFCAPPFDI